MENCSIEFNLDIRNQQVQIPIFENLGIELWIKREDEIHKQISGNKFRKLKYNILEAKDLQKKKLVTFGGAYSNHILAVAATGNLHGFETIGVIRGEELALDLETVLKENSTLRNASELGMKFDFIDRESYRNKDSNEFQVYLKKKFGDFYLIPEGGTNQLAIKGCEEILTAEDEKFDYICLAVGTGGTISGIINSVKNHQQVLGFPALKGDFLKNEIQQLISVQNRNWSLVTEYHFGGYGKFNTDLIRFMNEFKEDTGILLDPIYTGKMMYGLLDLIKKRTFRKGAKILAIHTGGIQGITGVNRKLRNKKLELIKV